jgi:hypothetical protein
MVAIEVKSCLKRAKISPYDRLKRSGRKHRGPRTEKRKAATPQNPLTIARLNQLRPDTRAKQI